MTTLNETNMKIEKEVLTTRTKRITKKERKLNRIAKGDLISDAITTIRNGYMAKKPSIHVPNTSFIRKALKVLQDEGYIIGFNNEADNGVCRKIEVQLRYTNKKPAIIKIKMVSSPSLSVYIKNGQIKEYYKDKCYGGYGCAVISTSQGIVAGWQAREKKIGGKILFRVM